MFTVEPVEGVAMSSIKERLAAAKLPERALQVMKEGAPKLLDFGVTNKQAWEVGLACGGKVQVFVERVD